MHRQIRSYDRQSAGHGFDQWMRKGLRIRRCDVKIASPVKLMQTTVRYRAQLHDATRDPQFLNQTAGGNRVIRSGIRAPLQLASEKQLNLFFGNQILQKRHCPKQRLKIAVIVVMTDKQKPQATSRLRKLLLNVIRERRLVSKKRFVIEAMMNNGNFSSGPTLQFTGESLAGRNRQVRPIDGPSGQHAP